jgi:hypothetical protein
MAVKHPSMTGHSPGPVFRNDPPRLGQEAVAEIEQDESVTEWIFDHRATADLDVERPFDQTSTCTREALGSRFGVLDEEVDLLLRMIRG